MHRKCLQPRWLCFLDIKFLLILIRCKRPIHMQWEWLMKQRKNVTYVFTGYVFQFSIVCLQENTNSHWRTKKWHQSCHLLVKNLQKFSQNNVFFLMQSNQKGGSEIKMKTLSSLSWIFLPILCHFHWTVCTRRHVESRQCHNPRFQRDPWNTIWCIQAHTKVRFNQEKIDGLHILARPSLSPPMLIVETSDEWHSHPTICHIMQKWTSISRPHLR